MHADQGSPLLMKSGGIATLTWPFLLELPVGWQRELPHNNIIMMVAGTSIHSADIGLLLLAEALSVMPTGMRCSFNEKVFFSV